MVYLTAEELEAKYPDPAFRSRFAELYGLSFLATYSILPSGYVPADEYAKAIALTDAGSVWEKRLLEAQRDLNVASARFALFGHFYLADLFVDPLLTDLDSLVGTMSEEIRAGKIRHPLVMGRQLYDKCFDMYGTKITSLGQRETLALLDGTDEGVFQPGYWVSGPFGLVRSRWWRDFRPSVTAPISHCLDPGCQGLHSVSLSTGTTSVGEAYGWLEHEFRGQRLPDWPSFWQRCAPDRDEYYADFNWEELPLFLGQGLRDRELRELLGGIIDADPANLRGQLPTLRSGSPSHLSTGDIISDLSRAECTQLLLLGSDKQIVHELDKLIAQGDVEIPTTEIRRTQFSRRSLGGWIAQRVEASSLGLRVVSNRRELASTRLKALLKSIYASGGSLEDLEWKLIDVPGDSVFIKMDRLVHGKPPAEVVRDFILGGPAHFAKAIDYLGLGFFEKPISTESRDALAARILWKLGFQVPVHPPLMHVLRTRLAAFKSIASAGGIDTEERREEVRSVGVNFFVALEGFLEEALALLTWALFTDHYAESMSARFRYNPRRAREALAYSLNGQPLLSGETLGIRAEGGNNLFAIIEGFRVGGGLCLEWLEGEREAEFRRRDEEFPGYANKSGLELFPFTHKIALLDLEGDAGSRLGTLMIDVGERLIRGNIMGIRNRIPHAGGEFPTPDEIDGAVTSVEQVISNLEQSGAAPILWLPSGARADGFGRSEADFEDYRGRRISLSTPSEIEACGVPPISIPQIILTAAPVRGTADVLRFRFEGDSEYSALWEGYPRRLQGETTKEARASHELAPSAGA